MASEYHSQSRCVRGVNLGNWLVLEKWMGDSPLSNAAAEDDRAWIDELPADERTRQLTEHWSTYVTKHTFARLARAGATMVRIPVPYHLFGSSHHIACVQYLDRAFDWAEQCGLGILLDLHTVPYSQNGFDNGGYTALCAWSQDANRINRVLALLEDAAIRYVGRRALWGIEPLNEPVSRRVYYANRKKMKAYPERMAASRPASHRTIASFYKQFYNRVRPIVGPEVKLVFHDRFSLRSWDHFDPGNGDPNVWIDTHQYVAFADKWLRRRDLKSYVALVDRMGARVQKAARYHPVLVGEWSLANHASDLAGLGPDEQRMWYRAFSQAQLAAWDRGGAGSCFWSLRVNAPNRENWCFYTCVERGWINLAGRPNVGQERNTI